MRRPKDGPSNIVEYLSTLADLRWDPECPDLNAHLDRVWGEMTEEEQTEVAEIVLGNILPGGFDE